MTLLPDASWLALAVSVAVALPPEPESVPVPSDVLPEVKFTVPVGDVVPVLALTVAVSDVVPVAPMVEGFAVTLVDVAVMFEAVLHPVIRLYTSTEPSPVTWSYPGPAE